LDSEKKANPEIITEKIPSEGSKTEIAIKPPAKNITKEDIKRMEYELDQQLRNPTELPTFDLKDLNFSIKKGECVAFIHEARLEMGLVHDDRIDNVNASERKFRRGSWDGTVFEVLMDEIKQRVAELSTESGYQMSKKAKREQRATFREFVDTIVEDESPNEVLTFRGGQVALDSWKEIIQLNFVRHCLQGGFQIQLMTNSTLQLIFGVESNVLNNNGAMSQIEKRLVMSKSSEYCKAADLEMTKKRRARTNAQNNFINAESEAF